MCKCPRCGQEKVFQYSPFHITKFTSTKDGCGNCKLNYNPEPGFFFGAMYWSYAMLVGLIVTLSIVFSMVGLFDYAVYLIPVSIILLLPFIFRYSRMLMLYVVYPIMFKGEFRDKD
ncbi:MAG: DUF983 domain-containing protein [Bacteroidia bacterium]|nr:DUF983 domain-containing protein [Bacteroidia bacterium]